MAYNIQGGKIFANILAWDLHNQSCKHEHWREVDADDGLEVVVLVVVGAEADDVEDRGREEDVGGDRDQLARQDELNLLMVTTITITVMMMNCTSTASVLSLPILTTWARVVVNDQKGFRFLPWSFPRESRIFASREDRGIWLWAYDA